MFIIKNLVFHFVCSIGRFFRKLIQLIVGRRHENEISISKTEPVTLEHIRVIGEMENDSNHPYQTSSLFNPIPRTMQSEWNSWGADDIFRQKRLSSNNSTTIESTNEQIDYFNDIAATIKKTPKIVLKKRVNENDNHSSSTDQHYNRLQMTDEPIEFKPGLDEWHEGGVNTPMNTTWDETDNLDGLSQEAAEALRESRRIEREKKIREHQQRKLDKESLRTLMQKRETITSYNVESVR